MEEAICQWRRYNSSYAAPVRPLKMYAIEFDTEPA